MASGQCRPQSLSKLAVAAIDFGTTCTGYAYYLRKDTRNFLSSINIDQAWAGSAKIGLQAPTTVLLDRNGKFHSFGFEAETKYETLTVTDDHKDWYYFRHFKMKLHHEKELSRDMLMEDHDGKPFRAISVFTEAIRYVKNHLLTKLTHALGDTVLLKQVTWVITVPAIWRDSAKQFMREAARDAGVPNEDLVLALEPESAAIFCKELAVKKSEGVDGAFLSSFDPGQKYLVADLGGGTVDTTVHEVLKDGLLKELHAATGGDWGGKVVNEAFEDLIREIVDPKVFSTFCKQKAHAWITLQETFERKKREFTSTTPISDIEIPRGLEDIYKQETGSELKKKHFRAGIQIVGDNTLRLESEIMKAMFRKATDRITDHIKNMLKELKIVGVSSLLLVGGFSESQIVSKSIRSSFKSLRVISPESASSAILRGAVMYGIDPRIIASRISPYTYGIHTRRQFDKNRHPARRMKKVAGRAVVENAFYKLVEEKNESVFVGQAIKSSTFTVINTRERQVFWKVFQSDDTDPVFCDDDGCRKIGKLSITIPEEIKDKKLKLRVHMKCKGSELKAVASIDEHGVTVSGVFDFLDKDYQYGGDSELDDN